MNLNVNRRVGIGQVLTRGLRVRERIGRGGSEKAELFTTPRFGTRTEPGSMGCVLDSLYDNQDGSFT